MVATRILSFLLLCVSLANAGAQVGKAIPPVHGAVLAGTPVNLPADLRGGATILVIGFSQDSRTQVSAWGKRLAADFTGTPDVRWFEVAELESVPRLLRGWVTKKVKASVSERGQTTFLIVTDHEREWKQAVSFSGADDAYVAIVDGSGVLCAVTHGPITDARYAEVKAAIGHLRASR